MAERPAKSATRDSRHFSNRWRRNSRPVDSVTREPSAVRDDRGLVGNPAAGTRRGWIAWLSIHDAVNRRKLV